MNAKTEPPLHVAWEITRRCNANCLHCSAGSGPETITPEVDRGQAMQIIDQLAEAGVQVLVFTGGEPLLREDLLSLIERAIGRGLHTHICTNGALVDDLIAIKLKQVGLNGVTVSLDGACAGTHDSLRCCPGLFDRAISAIRTLVKHGHHVGISFTPTVHNCQEAADVVHLAYLLGTDSVCLSQYIPTGRGTRDLMLSPNVLGNLAREVLRLQEDYRKRLRVHCHDCHVALSLPSEQQQQYRGCGAGTATAGIRADGTVTPCIFMSNAAGNLQLDRFADIWETAPVLNSLRDRGQLATGNCGSCRFKLVCGGCRAAAMAIHNNPLAGDPSCWLFPESPVTEEGQLAAS